jgi:hypothetical protein
LPRPARNPNSILGRRRTRGTHNPQPASRFSELEPAERPETAPEARQRPSPPLDASVVVEGRDAPPATRSAYPPIDLRASLTFRSSARFVRGLCPDPSRLILPAPNGRWPRLNPAATPEPTGGRRAISWDGRPPSKRAYSEYLVASEPEAEVTT